MVIVEENQVVVVDIRTGEVAYIFNNISPDDAVIAAHAIGCGDAEVWDYLVYMGEVVYRDCTVQCGVYITFI